MAKLLSRRLFMQAAASGAVAAGWVPGPHTLLAQAQSRAVAPDWAFNATIIEACSCNMFCPCYFSTVPSGHNHGDMVDHYCRFNMGYKVNSGRYGSADLNGVRFWIAGDLGADYSMGGDWAEISFDPSVTKEQREAVTAIIPHVYPVTWKSFTVGSDAAVAWEASNDRAEARLNDGRAGEIVLRRNPGMTDQPVVITNLRYFGAPRNSGFILMPNEVEAYRLGPKAFEFKGTNGFMITYDITSKDIKT